MIFKRKKITGYLLFLLVIAVVNGASAEAVEKIIFKDSFENSTLKSVWRQSCSSHGLNTLVEISDKAAFKGKKAVLLYDNDPKLATTLDYTGKFPKNGAVSGYLMFPENSKGMANSKRAYTSIQLHGKRGSLPVVISIITSTRSAKINVSGNKTVLPEVASKGIWIPWRIAWRQNGRDTGIACRISINGKETDIIPCSVKSITKLRLVSGWGSHFGNSVFYDAILIKSGSPLSTSPVKQETGAFRVEKVKTVFADTFSKPNASKSEFPRDWTYWQPSSVRGKAVYDRSYGRNDSNSLCFIDNQRCWWQRKQAVTPGKTYRFSGWVKVEQASEGKVALQIIPKVISKSTGKEIFLSRETSINAVKLQPGFWNYLEVFWTAPASGEYSEGKLFKIDIAFFGKNLSGKAWCDDVSLDEVIIKKPFRENFLKQNTSLKIWQMWYPSGIEGKAELAYLPSGFADKGALEVKHIEGKSGAFSAASEVERKIFGKQRQWTLLAHARKTGAGKASLDVQQLDRNGKILQHNTGSILAKAGDDWETCRLTFNIMSQTVQIRMLLLNSGRGSVAFDNVWLRPATAEEKTTLAAVKHFPVWMQLFPVDSFAAIDDAPAVISVPYGQTSAFCIQLAGDNTPGQDTIIDVDMPDWLTFRTAQIATYGKAPLKYEKIPSGKSGRITYRFKNPYNWQRAMWRGGPNPYQGILMVVNAKAVAGTEDQIVIRTQLGKNKGEERKVKLAVRKHLIPSPLKKFHVGLASLSWLNVRDATARQELYQTYIAAGIKHGIMHSTHGFAVDTMKEVGFTPLMWPQDPHRVNIYKHLPAEKRPALSVLANGKTTTHNIALGQLMNDPMVHQAYKKYLVGALKDFPAFSPYIFSDIEYCGSFSTSGICFHPSTIKAFRKYAGIPAKTKLDAKIIINEYYKKWSDFRNWITAEEHGLKRRLMREIRPDLKLVAYNYTLRLDGNNRLSIESPMNTLLYEPHIDIHAISYYNFEGILFLDHVDNDVKCLKKPVWTMPYVVENVSRVQSPSWNYHLLSKEELRLEIVAAAASGAKGFLPWVGRLLDADRLQAFNEGVTAVAKYEAFYMDGERVDNKVTLINPDKNVRYRVHQLDGKLLLTLFNCSNKNAKIAFKFNGKQQSALVKMHNFKQLELRN